MMRSMWQRWKPKTWKEVGSGCDLQGCALSWNTREVTKIRTAPNGVVWCGASPETTVNVCI